MQRSEASKLEGKIVPRHDLSYAEAILCRLSLQCDEYEPDSGKEDVRFKKLLSSLGQLQSVTLFTTFIDRSCVFTM